jgi:hypothetical protein
MCATPHSQTHMAVEALARGAALQASKLVALEVLRAIGTAFQAADGNRALAPYRAACMCCRPKWSATLGMATEMPGSHVLDLFVAAEMHRRLPPFKTDSGVLTRRLPGFAERWSHLSCCIQTSVSCCIQTSGPDRIG